MGYYTNATANAMTAVAVSIGEDSELIAVVASSGDPDLSLPFSFTDPSELATVRAMTNSPPFPTAAANRKAGLVVTGMKPGRTTLTTFVILDPHSTRTVATLPVQVTDLVEPNVDMYYFGRYLVWRRTLPRSATGSDYLVFDASSGFLSIASAQNQPNVGPVPEGLYRFSATLDPLQSTVSQANAALPKEPTSDGPVSNTRQGIQFLPRDEKINESWGSMRVRLEPSTSLPSNRGGFYLHNSTKGFTSGCIEVGNSLGFARQDFFKLLLDYATSPVVPKTFLTLKVKYRTPNTSTRGNTKG